MRKILIFCGVILLLAVSLSNSGTDLTTITGFFLQAGSTLLTIATSVLKQILSAVIKVL